MQVRIAAPGLSQLLRDLGRIDKSLRKAATDHLRKIAKETRDEATRRAPYRTGRLRRSYRYSVQTTRGASVYSGAEHAPVHEFGGTIAPKGTPIKIEKSAPVYGAIAARREPMEEELGNLLDAIAGANGFTGTSLNTSL